MEKKELDVGLKAFVQHGFVKKGETGDQIYGVCPFCGLGVHKHAASFYVNKHNTDWDCKSCGKNGGFQTFLQEVVEFCSANFKGTPAIELSKSRGLKLATLRKFRVGYNPLTKKYIVPIPDATASKIWDIRIYDGKRIISTTSCKVGLFGWDTLDTTNPDIWLCEGEWDAMAMSELQEALHFNGTILGVPGAGTFKADWCLLFKDKDVRALYDNDDAGRNGAEKCHKSIKSVSRSLKFLQWPQTDEFPDQYDVRDHYKKFGSQAYTFILDHLSDTPPGMEEVPEGQVGGGELNNAVFSGPGMHYQEVYAGYAEWLELKDPQILDVMFGTILANRIPGVPIWVFLTGPSGATKSELLMSLSTSPAIISTTTVTAPSLISGANFAGGQDPSLFAILNNRNLVIKDFTAIMSQQQLAVDEIMGYFRDAYDGKIEKRFGNGIYRRYDPCYFGVLAGVTKVVEVFTEQHVALGERFIRYNVETPENNDDIRVILRKAMGNTSHENEMQLKLRHIAHQVLNHDFNIIPVVPKEIAEKIMSLAIWVSHMRATVMRDKYSKEIIHSPFTELPTRLSKQFSKIGMGMANFRWQEEVTEVQYEIIKRIAKATAPSKMEEVVRTMYTGDPYGEFSIDLIAQLINLPIITTQRVMENLTMVNILEKSKKTKMASCFRLTENAHELIEHAEIYQKPEKKPLKTVIPKGRRL